MPRALVAGAAYFALVYAAGFALGPLRELLVGPLTGRALAVLVEAPFLVAAMWLAAQFAVRRLTVPADTTSRAAMGFLAFVLLMVAEAALAAVLRGWSLGRWLGHIVTDEGLLSLGLFLLFAAMPMLVRDAQTRP